MESKVHRKNFSAFTGVVFILYTPAMKSALFVCFFIEQSPLCHPESQAALLFGESAVLESVGLVSVSLDDRTVMGPSWIVCSGKQIT